MSSSHSIRRLATLRDFQLLEAELPEPALISPEAVLSKFTAAQLRKMELIVTFLREEGFKFPTRSQATNASERRRIQQSLDELTVDTHADLVRSFWNDQMPNNLADDDQAIRSARLNIRAAVELAKHSSGRQIDSDGVRAFLRHKPGYRASLFAFTTYLRRCGVDVHIPAPSRAPRKNSRETVNAAKAARNYLRDSEDFIDLRAGFAGWLVASLGVSLTAICQLPRTALRRSASGQFTIDVLGKSVSIPNDLSITVQRFEQGWNEATSGKSLMLFPGRPVTEPVTTEAISLRLRSVGVRVSVAGQIARQDIIKQATTAD